MSSRKNLRIRTAAHQSLIDLATHVEGVTGERPNLVYLAELVLTEGAALVRARPTLAVDFAPKARGK